MTERKAEALLAGITEYEPVTDPLRALNDLAGRMTRWMQVFEGIVADLNRIRYTTQAEQIDGRILLFERGMVQLGRLLVDIAKLNIDERLAVIEEAKGKLIIAAVAGGLADIDLSQELQQAARMAIGRRLQAAAAEERQRERIALASPR